MSPTIAAGGQLITDGCFASATKSGNSAPRGTAATNISGHKIIHGSYAYSPCGHNCNTSGTLLSTPLTLSNLNSTSDGNKKGVYFQPQTVDLSAYAGQTIELVFHVTNDYEETTRFLIDDISVTAN